MDFVSIFGSVVDDDEALQHALQFLPEFLRPTLLETTATALLERGEMAGSVEDIDRAIALMDQALALTPEVDSVYHLFRSNLSTALKKGFAMTDEQGVESSQQSAPEDHKLRNIRLNKLAGALQMRFEATGSSLDLDRTIATVEEVISSAYTEDHDVPIFLNNLGLALQHRFRRTLTVDDINRAISTNELAIACALNDHPDRAMFLNNFGNALQLRYEITDSVDDLNEAIAVKEQAVASTPQDHPHRSRRLSNLAVALLSRFKKAGLLKDINEAIALNEEAVKSASQDRTDRPMYLSNLGNAFQNKWVATGSTDDMSEAIAANSQAIGSLPQDSSERAICLHHVGDSLYSRFSKTGSVDDLDRATAMKEEAFAITAAPPIVRLTIASSLSELLIGRDNHRAKSLLQQAVHLLPTLSPRVLKRGDQQHNIAQFSHITSIAVSLSLGCGDDPHSSLRLLELGRGVVANLQLEVRSDISLLEDSHSDLPKQFYEIRSEIDSLRVNDIFEFNLEHRRMLFKRFERLLDDIRQLHGFENFLLGPTESELKSLAGRDSIVIFNVSKVRSDAFIVTEKQISFLNLPSLKLSDLERYASVFLSAVNYTGNKNYMEARYRLNQVLEWLWDIAVCPVLEEIGFTETPCRNKPWPRIWWIPTGLLTLFPIHAAGYHDSVGSRSVIDRVISSYATSLKSLAYAREKARKLASSQKQKAILVSMAKTPEYHELPFAEKEVMELQKQLGSVVDITLMQSPTREELLSLIPEHQIIHLSCHGHLADDPSQSSLLLRDWKVAPLTVSDLTALNSAFAEFAYLSACHTSSTTALPDESISLSSAIQLSGYPSVVGTLWSVADNHSANVATEVYTWLLEGGVRVDAYRAAEGLHRAVRGLRDRTRIIPGFIKKVSNEPLIWGAYIHVGI